MSLLSPKLLVLAIATLINLVLLATVYRSNSRSATHRLFAALSLVVTCWLVASYLSTTPETNLIWARLTIFFAAPMTMLLFLFSYTLPKGVFSLGGSKTFAVVASTAAVMMVAVSPYAFKGIDSSGGTPHLIIGLGMGAFGVLATSFSLLSVYMLWKKYRNTVGVEKEQIRPVFLGAAAMLGLLIATVLLPVLLWQNDFFAGLIPLYSLIFLGMTAYAIVRHHLFNMKVIATEALTSILWIVLFARLVVSESVDDRIVGGFVFLLSLIFGVLLIQSVRREVRQREELQRLSEELKTTNFKLEELSRFKTQLLSLASHQIKSPLAAIKGFTTILLECLYGPVNDKVKGALDKIKSASDDLINLVNMLLDLRRVEEGRMAYEFARVDLKKLAQGEVALLEPLARNKGLKLEFACGKPEIWVNADAQKLVQVIQNLVDNAIKYTPSGFVRVELGSANGQVTLKVSDSGLGISPTLLPQLFEEFVRDERIKKEIRGTGLGLYIARKIVEAHNGKIWAESEGEGKGSKFHLKIKEVS